MTIEIRQLVIRAVVESGPSTSSSTPRRVEPLTAASAAERAEPEAGLTAEARDALISACVREVLRELRRARGR